ncbi:putative acyltransferase 3 [Cupriavidus taiwanensis]|uniref:Acyltransferase 3 n=1 Tax=Cupriavidus taiwanensis TaxID=164546 RepID=A0A375EBK1_9BURK|nr:acyltransferase [Cupriavidus taiwanensis]SOZ17893.1 putative acyltransferase 3 [Cupriavidus taiwanensis]SOZ30479.1 putative acyltransferase 3 [Cupriavidus taiwanensis]SOZ49748.1 putative acyltransferase 3 [Cupriavidus taiwanensis]SOZ64893.1 putative acyltransferase 3 [Cupriavidus taiwanensis]SOZ65731.1 putative acyltransferase 3 [Cupriavidus taiwanensis]
MSSRPSRLPCIDALKAVSSQLIVLHHLAFYGPMSDAAYQLAPGLVDWLYDYARIAVQVFLVISGFLAARSLAPDGRLEIRQHPLSLLWRRYQKLVVPFAAAILLSVAGAAVARHWMTHDSIPASPTLGQLLAHLTLLHDIVDVDALSAGAWYVAIDLQLFALLLGTLWAARAVSRGRAPAGVALSIGLVALAAVASLFWFNRDAAWDIWAVYFFGAYGMGTLAYWASAPGRPLLPLALLGAVALGALVLDFRLRIAVALATALLLALARRGEWLERWPRARVVGYLGRISYSVFLVHFPVCLVVNALMSHLAPGQPVLNALGMAAAWVLSNVAGAVFYRFVESAQPFAALRALLGGRGDAASDSGPGSASRPTM